MRGLRRIISWGQLGGPGHESVPSRTKVDVAIIAAEGEIEPAKITKKGTYAVLDLRSASTQITFKPLFSAPDSMFLSGEHRYDPVFVGWTHTSYQHSYVGYVLMKAWRHVHQLLDV